MNNQIARGTHALREQMILSAPSGRCVGGRSTQRRGVELDGLTKYSCSAAR